MTTLETMLAEIEGRTEAADNIICTIHSTAGEKGIHMSIPPQDTDSDIVMTKLTREDIPKLIQAIRVLSEGLDILKDHPCDHKYSPDCKGCNYDRVCNETLTKATEILEGK